MIFLNLKGKSILDLVLTNTLSASNMLSGRLWKTKDNISFYRLLFGVRIIKKIWFAIVQQIIIFVEGQGSMSISLIRKSL